MYFIPNLKDYCKTSTPCPRFRREVRMQGSGTIPGNKLLTYKGKTKELGNCKTAFGAAGVCLTPYISIAADPSKYSMGDIIEMPSIKGKKIKLPDGTSFKHPGYFIVQDSGGAIKGSNRFDFFTGSQGMYNERNQFGVKGDQDTQMVDKNDCSDRKKFTVIRRGSANYEQSLASINETQDYIQSQKRYVVASPLSGLGEQ